MQWTLLLPSGPTVFEVSDFHEQLNEYDITGEGAAILAICGAHNSVPGVKPIYLPRGRHRTMPKPVYIRPEIDTLYIPFPEQLDTIAMSLMSENQVLKRIGIVSSAFDCLQMGTSPALYRKMLSHTKQARTKSTKLLLFLYS